jgi:hypothetical protein
MKFPTQAHEGKMRESPKEEKASTAVNQATLRKNATSDPADNKVTTHNITQLGTVPPKPRKKPLCLL